MAASPAKTQHALLLDAALKGAGTSVWAWDILTDKLDEGDGGHALLGYPVGSTGHTQIEWNRVIHPDDLDAIEVAYQRHVRGETAVYESEYRALAYDGQWCWIAERGRIVEWASDGRPSRMVGTLSDITQRRLAEGQAAEVSDRLAKIAQHVPGVLFQFRLLNATRGYFPYVSASCLPVIGIEPEALMRDAAVMLKRIERADRERMMESIRQSARSAEPWAIEFRLHRPGAAPQWMTGTATPQREADGTMTWHGYLADTTQLRELDQARQAAATAAASSAAKSEFLSRMSHELRTPLNAVLGFSQLMEIDEQEPLASGQRKRVELIREAGTHLLDVIAELLDLTRIESGNLEIELCAVPLMPLMSECMEMLRPQAGGAGVTLHLVHDDDAASVRSDRTRLKQVLLNLLGNAIKYNRRGGSVQVACEVVGERVAIRVADTGVGIAPAELTRLFEPFNRGAHQRSGIEGIGIGLAVTRGLVELMQGTLEVQSRLEMGSTFTVTLQAAPR